MQISNRTIAMLLIATIIVYLGGTFISLNRLADFGYPSITGMATNSTSSGNVSVQISSQVSITWAVSHLNWGSGYVSTGCNSNCTMFVNTTDSMGNSADSFDSTCCKEFNWSNQSLLLRNNGNQNVNLQMNITANATDWFGTNTPAEFSFKIVNEADRVHDNTDVNDTADSCLGNSTHANGWWGYNSTSDWTALDSWVAAPKYICGDAAGFNFTSLSTKNEANFDFKIVIPITYTTPGIKSTLITMLGTASS